MFDIFRKELKVKRPPIGHYVDGLWVDTGQEEEFTILASVQGVNAEVLQTLPEGYRTSETHILYTNTRLNTSTVNLRNPDVVVINDNEFQVIKVTEQNNIKDHPTNHYEVVVVKENIE